MEKIVRKVGAVLLAAAIATSLTACKSSKDTSNNQKVTLTFWNNYTNDVNKTMSSTISDWNKANPNIQITANATENNAYKTKIKTAIAANDAPDIIYSWAGGFTQPFVQSGKILDLDSYLNDGTKDKMLTGALTNITYNGKVYGLTYNQQAGVLYVNSDLFTKYNVKIPTTFEELLTAVSAFKSHALTPMGVGEKDEWPGMWYYDMIALRESGVKLSLDALNKKASYDQAPFSDAAAKLLQLVNAGAFASDALSTTRDQAIAEFDQGQIPMYFGGNFDAGTIDTSSVKGKIQAVKFPTIGGGKGTDKEYLGGGADALLVCANSKYKDQAVKAIKYLAPTFSSRMYLVGSGLPEWKYDDVDQTKVDQLSKEIMDNIVSGSTGSVPAWDLYLTGNDAQTHLDLVASLFGKQISAADFAKNMQAKVGAAS